MIDVENLLTEHLRTTADGADPRPDPAGVVEHVRARPPGGAGTRRGLMLVAAAAVVALGAYGLAVAVGGEPSTPAPVASTGPAADDLPAGDPLDDDELVRPAGPTTDGELAPRLDIEGWDLVAARIERNFAAYHFRDAGRSIRANVALGDPGRVERAVDGVPESTVTWLDDITQVVDLGDEGFHYFTLLFPDAVRSGGDEWLLEIDGTGFADRATFLAVARSAEWVPG